MTKTTKQKKLKKLLQKGFDTTLKVNMKVMITENINVEDGLCNGTQGIIINIDGNDITVNTKHGNVTVTYYTIAQSGVQIKYMPLKQSNAITIHKCQGSTLLKVNHALHIY